MLKLLFFLVMSFGVSSAAFATNYYIDCQGNDSNNGLSATTAWASFKPTESTNFLKPGDVVNVKAGCTFTGSASEAFIYSAGTAANPITIQPYGTGANPVFDATVDPSTVPGWSGWTVSDSTNGVYVSNVPVPWSVNSIIVDGTYSLRKLDSYQCSQGVISKEPYSECQNGAGSQIYIHLAQEANPSGHKIAFSKYGNGDGDGHTRGQFGVHDSTEQYVNINNISIVGSNSQGFSSGAPYVNFNGVSSLGAAREGIYIISHAVQNGTGAAYNTINQSTFSWSNSNFGQQVTIESPHVDLVDVISKNGWMAGIDWLDYTSDTNASFGRCIRCIAHDNGQRSWSSDYNGYDPVGIYVDGGHDIQIIDSVVYQSPLPAGITSQNAIYGIAFQTEHPSIKPESNNFIINSLVYGINYQDVLLSGAINCTGTACNVNDNMGMIGTTLIRGGYQLMSMNSLIPNKSLKGVFLYNNVYYNGSNTVGAEPLINSYNVTSDYNVYYTSPSGQYIWDPSITLSAWQGASGQDAHSQYANPLFAGSGITGEIDQSYHLSSVAAGQNANSPAIGAATHAQPGSAYVYSSIGTVRTDNVVDSSSTPAAGYHYLAKYSLPTTGTGGGTPPSGGTTPPTPTVYSLTISTSGSGFGMIFDATNLINCGVNPGATQCSASINGGTAVSLTATPASGSSFNGWTITGSQAGTCTSTTSPCTLTVTGNTTVTANFGPTTTTNTGLSITTQPANQTVTVGQTAAFSVVASGAQPLYYQWQKDGVNITGANSSTYTTPPTTAADDWRTFKVVINNGTGVLISNMATLRVNAAAATTPPTGGTTPPTGGTTGGTGAPSITTQPADQTVAVGQAATFSVAASGAQPLYYQWQKDGVNITGANSPTYTTAPTTTADDWRTFKVVVNNSAGVAISNLATLRVNAAAATGGTTGGTGAPSITTQPANKTVTAGQTATFSVVATGGQPLYYQWQKDGVNIAGANSPTYTTPPTTTADNWRTFKVVVSNTKGVAISNMVVLMVNQG
ncbi:MAG: immunoglobulin domain-containing protein [Candidatus Omnitrophica bacterium]|nr:immunoglobulin domain-containing protein [Candidatus Omnitrophota bacterium]